MARSETEALSNAHLTSVPSAPQAKVSSGVKEPLSLKNVGGVFVCLIFGLCVAVLVNAAEFVAAAYRTSREERVTTGITSPPVPSV